MLKKIAILFIILSLFLSIPSEIWAAKLRTTRGKTTTATRVSRSTGGVTYSVKFRSDRKGIILNLSRLDNASSVSYELTYTSNGITQGVRGSIKPTGSSETRELLFGTCSGNVCRYHTNIRDARLVITSKLKSGKTTRKPYRLRV